MKSSQRRCARRISLSGSFDEVFAKMYARLRSAFIKEVIDVLAAPLGIEDRAGTFDASTPLFGSLATLIDTKRS